MEYKSDKKFVTRTVNLKSGIEKIPDYENDVIMQKYVCLVDWDEEIPANIKIDEERTVKVKVPIEDFVKIGEIIEN